jgi:hypothetical protein
MPDWTEIANGRTDSVPGMNLDFTQFDYRLEFVAPVDLPEWLPGAVQGALSWLPVNVNAYLSEPHTLEIELSRG